MLIFVLQIKKRLVTSFCKDNQGELERTDTTKNFCWCRCNSPSSF